jgi:hypothetical protein
MSRIAAAIAASLTLLSLPSARAGSDPLRQEIEALVGSVDAAVTAGDYAFVATILTPDCTGASSLTPRMDCPGMYGVEIGALLVACGADCPDGRFVLEHEVREVERLQNGDAWAWTASRVTTPGGGRVLVSYEAMNVFTKVRRAWKMKRIILSRVPGQP